MTVVRRPVSGQALPDLPDTITVCSWYMQATISAECPDSGVFDSNFVTRHAKYFNSHGTRDGWTPIDNFSLFDCTMLHEVSLPRASLN